MSALYKHVLVSFGLLYYTYSVMARQYLRRLLLLYVCAFASVVIDMPSSWRTLFLWVSVVCGVKHPAPVVLSGVRMFLGECVAVRRPDTWRYEDPNATLQVPAWLLPLWILAAQFCVDMHVTLPEILRRLAQIRRRSRCVSPVDA